MIKLCAEPYISLMSALIGVLGALLGVIITEIIESRRRRKEKMDNAMPVIINYPRRAVDNPSYVLNYYFQSDGRSLPSEKVGYFKNANDSVIFLDYIETETKKYYPLSNSAVDRSTVFIIRLQLEEGETMAKLTLYCHDIYGNKYCYDGNYNYKDSHKESQIIFGDIQAVK